MIYGINNKKTLKTAAVLVLCAFMMTILPVLPAEAAVVTRINTSAVNLTDKSDYAVVTLDSLADQADMTISMVGDYLTCFKVEIAGSAITPQNSTIDAADTSTEISMGKDTVATLKISLNHAAITDILLPPPILGKVRITDSMGKNYEVTVTYNGSSIGQVYTSTNVVNLKQDVMEGDGDDTFYVWLDSTAEDGENVVIALDTERDGTTGMYRDNFYALLLNTDKNIQNSEIIIQQDSGETESYNNIVYPKVANGKSIVVKMTHNEPLKIRLCKKNTEADNSNLTAGAKLGKITFTVVGSNRGSGADVYYEQQDVTLNRISFRESTLAMAKGTNYFFHPVFEPTGTNIWDLVWASDDDTIVSFSGDSLGRKNNQIGLLTAHEVTAPEHPVKVRVYSRANPTDIQDELFVYVYEAFEPTTDYLIMHTNDQPHFALDEAALNQGTPNVYGDQQTTADGTEKITVKGFTDPFHLGLYDANKYQDIANGQITDASKNDFLDEGCLPETMEELIWTSGNSSIVKIEQINNSTVIVTPRKVGDTFIKVKGKTSGNVKVFQIEVKEVPVEKLEMDRSLGFEDTDNDGQGDLLKIAKGNRVTLDVAVTPYNATNIDLRWKSNDVNLVAVDSDGAMRAVKIDPNLVEVKVYNYDSANKTAPISDAIKVQVVEPLLIPYIDISEYEEKIENENTINEKIVKVRGNRINFSYRYSINTQEVDPKEPTFKIKQGEESELWVEYAVERQKMYQYVAGDVLWETVQKNLVWLEYTTDKEVKRINLVDNTGNATADSDWYTIDEANGDHVLYTAHLMLKAASSVKKMGEVVRVVGTNVYYKPGNTPALDSVTVDVNGADVAGTGTDTGYPGFYVEIESIPPNALVISGMPKLLGLDRSKKLKVSADERIKDKRVTWEIVQIEILDTTGGATNEAGLVKETVTLSNGKNVDIRNDNGRFDLSKGAPYYTPLAGLDAAQMAEYAIIDKETGIITGKRPCRALVRATSVSQREDGTYATAEAYVYIGNKIRAAKLNENNLTMKEGEVFDLNVAMKPMQVNTDYFGTDPEAEPKIIRFVSENPYIAEVDEWTGKVTAIHGSMEEETTYIYAHIGNDEKRLRCRVNIVGGDHTWTDMGGIKENSKIESTGADNTNDYAMTYESDVILRVGKVTRLTYRMVENKADIADVKWHAITDNVFVDQVGNVTALANPPLTAGGDASAKAIVVVELQDKSGKRYKVTYNITIKPELSIGNEIYGYSDSISVEMLAGQMISDVMNGALKAKISPSEDLEGEEYAGDWEVTEWKTNSNYLTFYVDGSAVYTDPVYLQKGQTINIAADPDLKGKSKVTAVVKVKNRASGETATLSITIKAR